MAGMLRGPDPGPQGRAGQGWARQCHNQETGGSQAAKGGAKASSRAQSWGSRGEDFDELGVLKQVVAGAAAAKSEGAQEI